MKKTTTLFLAVLFALPAWAGGDSSDGHTHAAPTPVPTSAMAPRAIAATEEFEVVAVLEGKKLVVYVDRFASNEPVAKAKVEIEGAGLKGLARETATGTYVMDVAATIPPARHPLTITIEAGDTTDLLTATLDISSTATDAEPVAAWRRWTGWFGAALLLLAGGAWLIALHKKKGKGI